MIVYFDTNVVVDILLKREPFFEDSVISAIAIRNEAEYIITRNVDDFAKSSVPAISPNDFLKMLKL